MAQNRYHNQYKTQSGRNVYRGSSYYTYGNVAYDLEPHDIPSYDTDEENKRRRKEQIRQERMERREAQVISVRMIAIVLLLFVGCMIFMGMSAVVSNANYQLRQQRGVLAEARLTNAVLEAEIVEQVDLNYIREEAALRLGMSEPQAYQIVYIDVPKESYTVQYAVDEAVEKPSSIFAFLTNIWKGNE